jgi:tRNA G18 (ribose-2'-O)-methylase SpoU
MKDKELARDGNRFIAEGENVVRRLLRSNIPAESVFVASRKLESIAPLAKPETPVYSASDDVIEKIIGFEFHSGVLACGIRPPSPTLQNVLPKNPAPLLAVVCQEITNLENMGALIRISAAFGANALILGERCCDPYYRMSIRVSMGTIFSMPIVQAENLLNDLREMSEMNIETFAAVLSPDAEPLYTVRPPARLAIAFGSEAHGLDEQTISLCRRQVAIPMQLRTDSLNVATAAAVILYHMTLLKELPRDPV